MTDVLKVGRTLTTEHAVSDDLTADRFGNPGVRVLATPALVALIEACAIRCAAPTLAEGQGTVGTRVNMQHLAPTPVGMKVTIRVELVELDGKRLGFQFQAHDERDLIARGTHERFILGSMERFLSRAAEKSGAGD